jgi:membrane-bound ClpP family serine protease
MESLLVWGVVLIAGGLLLIFAELFLPTGGILGLLAAGCAIAGVVCMFRVSATWGALGALVVAILGPMSVGFAMKIWPSTPMGRRIIGGPSDEVQEQQRIAAEEARRQREAIIGAQGTVVVDLRPMGVIDINGKRYDAISEIAFCQAGSRIKVTGIGSGDELRVRPLA